MSIPRVLNEAQSSEREKNFTMNQLIKMFSTAFAAQLSVPNLLINGDFQINQRAFAGGALALSTYGFDRWKASSAGAANVTLSGFTLTLASGELEQVIEPAVFGFASLASTAITVSVDTPTVDLTVQVGSTTGTLKAGAGRQSVTITTAAGDTGNVSCKIKSVAGGSAAFGRVKCEVGVDPTAWIARDQASELTAARRYYREITVSLDWQGTSVGVTAAQALGLESPLRATPTLAIKSGSPVAVLNLFGTTFYTLSNPGAFQATNAAIGRAYWYGIITATAEL